MKGDVGKDYLMTQISLRYIIPSNSCFLVRLFWFSPFWKPKHAVILSIAHRHTETHSFSFLGTSVEVWLICDSSLYRWPLSGQQCDWPLLWSRSKDNVWSIFFFSPPLSRLRFPHIQIMYHFQNYTFLVNKLFSLLECGQFVGKKKSVPWSTLISQMLNFTVNVPPLHSPPVEVFVSLCSTALEQGCHMDMFQPIKLQKPRAWWWMSLH